VGLTTFHRTQETATEAPVLGASLCIRGATPEDLYGAVLDVRSFPLWAPGVRRVEVLGGPFGEAGMVSEWEVSVLRMRRRVVSELREAEPCGRLRWTYDEGPILGWGGCEISPAPGGVRAEFRTALRPADPLLRRLMGAPAVRSATVAQIKGALKGLGRLVAGCGREANVLVGPLASSQEC